MSSAIIIFVRNPEWGKVKTRLAATVGNNKALEIYIQLLEHTLNITKDLAAHKYVFYADAIPDDDLWKEAGYHRLLQSDGDLGTKMRLAFQTLFANGYKNIIIIGSDCIELTPRILENAFGQLETHDVVIGPANDGGYYLLGMKGLHESFFQNKAWSTGEVYTATVADFNSLQLSFYSLPVLIDIDTEEDWNAVIKKG
ncbi:MAG TPA: TIGR04282 family arsenosugar biosynthesis glycosyltransferase [Flavisolibacter sp.]|nr:TIGR04282 family arsenosugar biosynthesis glycosyltransferase [Flavisolibacter sp.]